MNTPFQWHKLASETLSTADSICSSAKSILTSGEKLMTSNFVITNKNLFLLAAIEQQLRVLVSVFDNASKVRERISKKIDIIKNGLDKSLKELEISLDNLKNIKIDSKLNITNDTVNSQQENNKENVEEQDVKGKRTTQPQNLYNFVSEEGIDKLKSTILKLKSEALNLYNNEIIINENNFKDEITEFWKKLREIENKQSKIETNDNKNGKEQQPETQENELEESSIILLKMNDHAEAMALLLESLTNHYDLCTKALEIQYTNETDNEDDTKELFEVLQHDSEQLDDVLAELSDRYSEIKSSNVKLINIYNDTVEIRSYYEIILNELLIYGKEKLALYTESLPLQLNKVNSMFEQKMELVEKCDALSDYYKCFEQSYYSLILEVARRFKVSQQMDEMVNNFVEKLNVLRNGMIYL